MYLYSDVLFITSWLHTQLFHSQTLIICATVFKAPFSLRGHSVYFMWKSGSCFGEHKGGYDVRCAAEKQKRTACAEAEGKFRHETPRPWEVLMAAGFGLETLDSAKCRLLPPCCVLSETKCPGAYPIQSWHRSAYWESQSRPNSLWKNVWLVLWCLTDKIFMHWWNGISAIL